MKRIHKYRIQDANRLYLYTGTIKGSWFTIEEAREIVRYDLGQRIVEHDGVNMLWESF